MQALKIREASKFNAQIISELASKIWPVCFQKILTPEQINNMLQKIYSVPSLIEQMEEGQKFWIVSFDGQDVGYGSAFTKEDVIWLRKLYILPDIQGKGCGKLLIKTVINYYPNLTKMSLFVHRDNVLAQKFYEHLGFKIEREEPVQMGDYHFIDLVMSKLLTK